MASRHRIVVARWWEKRHYEVNVRPVGDCKVIFSWSNRSRVASVGERPKKKELTEGWKHLHDEELHKFYSSPDITMMKWVGHTARMGSMRNVYKVLVWKPQEKEPLRRPRHKWEDNIVMDVRTVHIKQRHTSAQQSEGWRLGVQINFASSSSIVCCLEYNFGVAGIILGSR
jgi:hypothetical protein